jgi:hypothetical protein
MAISAERRAWVCAYLKYIIFRNAFCPPEALQDALDLQAADIGTLLSILRTRYLKPRISVPKCGQLHLAWEYAANPAHHHRFMEMLRLSPVSFNVLAGLIRDHHVFRNNSNVPQAPVEIQLGVMLYRLGRYGHNVVDVARMAGIGEGTVIDYTERCFAAILPLHNQFVRPLTQQEKEIEKTWVEKHTGVGGEFREGWVMYDGTIVVLYRRPDMDGDGYYTRKSNYGLNLQVSSSHIQFYSCHLNVSSRLEMYLRTFVSLTTRTATPALLTTPWPSDLAPLFAMLIGSLPETNSHGPTLPTTYRSVLYQFTSDPQQICRRMRGLTRLFRTCGYGLSTLWVLSRVDLPVSAVSRCTSAIRKII